MMKIPKWFWAVAIIALIMMALFLKFLFGAITSSIGLSSFWVPAIAIVILAVLIYSLMTPIKFKTPTLGPINWGWLIKWSCITMLCGVIIFGIRYGYNNWNWIKSYYPSVVGYFQQMSTPTKQNKWVLSWEVETNDRVPTMTSAEFEVTMTANDEEKLCFIVHYKDGDKERLAECYGKRTKDTRYHRYIGTWSQGKPGDSDYDYGTWTLDRISKTKFKGSAEDSKGIPWQQELEFK